MSLRKRVLFIESVKQKMINIEDVIDEMNFAWKDKSLNSQLIRSLRVLPEKLKKEIINMLDGYQSDFNISLSNAKILLKNLKSHFKDIGIHGLMPKDKAWKIKMKDIIDDLKYGIKHGY